jgi:hypothetical protein
MQGLMQVFEEMFERLEHRLCLRHLYANFKKKFGGGTRIRDLMMGAAKATYFQAWEAKMTELKAINPKAWEWLVKNPRDLWCKHAFSFFPKCDVLMNNLSEAFNATILVARDKPILTMCEWIRKYLMNRNATLRQKVLKWDQKICPKPKFRLDKEIELCGNWEPHWSGDEIFQVEHIHNHSSFIVDISKRTCSCNFWDLIGIPCRHAVAALGYRSHDPADFVDDYYSIETYKRCYSFAVSPINGQDMWLKPGDVETEEILLPSYKKGPGRPKKLRRRDPVEDVDKRRTKLTYQCTRCGGEGHKVTSCTSLEVDPEAQKRKVTFFFLFLILIYCLLYF